MQEYVVDQSLNRRLNTRRLWRLGLGSLGVALLLAVALGSPATPNHLVPKVPGHAQGITARVGWYLHSGQLQADFHTLAAAYQFLRQPVSVAPSADDDFNQPVAGKAAPSLHKS